MGRKKKIKKIKKVKQKKVPVKKFVPQKTFKSNEEKTEIKNLIEKLKIPNSKVAIELNREIVNKKNSNKILLKKGDKVEIVHFIGGG